MRRDLDNLEYLHDAVLRCLSFTIDEHGLQKLSLEAICDSDAGYLPWQGKLVQVVAEEVLLLRNTSCGYSAGPDVVERCCACVSDRLMSEVSDLVRLGVQEPGSFLTVHLNSGTKYEVACMGVVINIL